MFKKINSTTLFIILAVLLGAVLFNKFYLSKRSESTFSAEFVQIDTAKVNQILIYPKAENKREVKIVRQGKTWQLQRDNITAPAGQAAINMLLQGYADIKSQALACSDKSCLKQFDVDDSSSTRIKFLTTDNQTYDLVIGKFAVNPQTRTMVTYIRRYGDDHVYAVNGFLSYVANKAFNDWRNKTFISGNASDWNKLTFAYPADSGFVLLKQNGAWTMNGKPTDSAAVAGYLNTISHLDDNSFAPQYSPTNAPVLALSIEGANQGSPVTISAYVEASSNRFILHSSLNPDAWFNDDNAMEERVFADAKIFLNKKH